jgi:tRNA pseudouridine55 synthase
MFGLDKPLGLTSLQALDALRAADPSLRDRRLGHAGRLDPMADGLLTVLVDEETRDAPALRAQDKTYEIDVALGLATDSFDSFGLVTGLAPDVPLDDDAFARACRAWEGVVAQRYPPFSQARVGGRSLLAWGAAGLAMDRPVATRTIASIVVIGRRVEAGEAIVAEAVRRTTLVRAELRQDAIAARWRAREGELAGRSVAVVSLRVACSAGTYMRSLAHDLGAAVGAPSIAWRIRRTRAGALRVEDARRL